MTATLPASGLRGRWVRYRITSRDTRARDSSIAAVSSSSSAMVGWNSGSISEGADSARAPIGAALEPSRMKSATNTSNCAPVALAACEASSTPSGVSPSRTHPT